jgi:hypothetical protein
MENALTGGLVTILTQLLKKVPAVPLNEGQKGKIKAMVVIVSALCPVAMAYVTGDLSNIEVVLKDAILNAIAAFGLYSATP